FFDFLKHFAFNFIKLTLVHSAYILIEVIRNTSGQEVSRDINLTDPIYIQRSICNKFSNYHTCIILSQSDQFIELIFFEFVQRDHHIKYAQLVLMFSGSCHNFQMNEVSLIAIEQALSLRGNMACSTSINILSGFSFKEFCDIFILVIK